MCASIFILVTKCMLWGLTEHRCAHISNHKPLHCDACVCVLNKVHYKLRQRRNGVAGCSGEGLFLFASALLPYSRVPD